MRVQANLRISEEKGLCRLFSGFPNVLFAPSRKGRKGRKKAKKAPISLTTHTPVIKGVEVHPLDYYFKGVGCQKHLLL